MRNDKSKILIIEDDSTLAAGLCRALSAEDIDTDSCDGIKAARDKMSQEAFSLIILDINLPDGNGFDYLQEIRRNDDTPVIMLTANDMETDIVAGLEAGADDYITKPFSLAVLRARVRTQLRKQTVHDNHETDSFGKNSMMKNSAIVIDDYVFDFDKMEYFYKGEPVELSRTEQKLLKYLVDYCGSILSRSFLIDHIWTDGAAFVNENALSVSVKRLRDKLSAQEYIKTIYGIGYVWTGARK